MTLRSILVPLDGSQFGEHALSYAMSLARRAGARVDLVHVHESATFPDLGPSVRTEDDWEARRRSTEYIEGVARRVTDASPVPCRPLLLEGRVADTLCDFTSTSAPDLIVLTTHGRGPLSRFWLGSVATDLVQRAPAPVLLVRPKETLPDLAADLAPRRILIPLDGSPFGEQIIPLAVAVGGLAGAEYRLLRVVPPVITSSGGGLGGRTVADQLRAEASGYLAGLTHRVPAFRTAGIQVAVDWPPAGAILADAEANGVDLIALETRGRSGLAKLLLGSVADKVVRGATVPVLLRRPTGG